MQLPSWLAGLTGADKFANNPANGFSANIGDMMQAAGHSMAQHYRGKGGAYGGPEIIAGLNGSTGATDNYVRERNSSLAGILPGSSGPAITGGALAPAANAQPPLGAAAPAEMSPEARAAITARLNGAPAWGQADPTVGTGQPSALPGMAGQIPLGLLLQMGLR